MKGRVEGLSRLAAWPEEQTLREEEPSPRGDSPVSGAEEECGIASPGRVGTTCTNSRDCNSSSNSSTVCQAYITDIISLNPNSPFS